MFNLGFKRQVRAFQNRRPLDLTSLKKAVDTHGADVKKLKFEFPSATSQIIRERLADYQARKDRQTPFTISEDIEIISKVLSSGQKNSETWADLAIRLGRPFNATRYRFYNHIKLKAQDNSIGNQEESLKVSLTKERNRLSMLSSQKNQELSEKLQKEWTPEMDKHLLDLLRKIGPFFSLLTKDFPQFSGYEIRNRHNLLSSKVFLPHEDEIIKNLYQQKRFCAEDLMKLLPHHSIYHVWRRKNKLKENRLVLNLEDIKSISLNVEKFGRSYFNHKKNEYRLKGWSVRKLKAQWAIYEPSDQKNGVWSFKRDLKLMEIQTSKVSGKQIHPKLCWSDFGMKEMETRWEVLQRSPKSHHMFRKKFFYSNAGG